MILRSSRILIGGLAAALATLVVAQDGRRPTSYTPVVMQEDFASVMKRMSAAKPGIMKRQMALLEERYDLSNKPAAGVTMSRGKPVQAGVRVKLRGGG